VADDRAHSPGAICFSGGGFRAALYGLGVARYLAEAGLLAETRVLSGVSGGSLAAAAIAAAARDGAAALADVPFERGVFEPFLATVANQSIRDAALRRWLARRLTTRAAPRNVLLARTLAEGLVPGARQLADLPDRPQLVIAATSRRAARSASRSRSSARGISAMSSRREG
jgi:NTE family protein